jgi:hypothetical protein
MQAFRRFTTRPYVAVSLIAVGWWVATCLIAFALTGAEDNPDMSAPVPWSLKAAWSVVSFPMLYILPPDHSSSVRGEQFHQNMLESFIVINSLLWAIILVVIFYFARFLVKLSLSRRRERGQG